VHVVAVDERHSLYKRTQHELDVILKEFHVDYIGTGKCSYLEEVDLKRSIAQMHRNSGTCAEPRVHVRPTGHLITVAFGKFSARLFQVLHVAG
jgi:hypothetical protein